MTLPQVKQRTGMIMFPSGLHQFKEAARFHSDMLRSAGAAVTGGEQGMSTSSPRRRRVRFWFCFGSDFV
jgi:hypothetical protein